MSREVAIGHIEPMRKPEKKPVKFSNLLLGAGLNMFEVTTLGQPLEVMKTTMAANRSDGMLASTQRIWARGGVLGCMYLYFPYRVLEGRETNAYVTQSTRVSSPGRGSKPRQRALSSSS